MMEHRSSSRCKKPVNYSSASTDQTEDDTDDHDFACNSSTTRSKRPNGQQQQPEKKKLKIDNQNPAVLTKQKQPGENERVPVDQKIFERDLKLAIERSKKSPVDVVLINDHINQQSCLVDSFVAGKMTLSNRLIASSESKVCDASPVTRYKKEEEDNHESDDENNINNELKDGSDHHDNYQQSASVIRRPPEAPVQLTRNELISSTCHINYALSSLGHISSSSPSLGLRLGLSRNVRVKSLHGVLKTFK